MKRKNFSYAFATVEQIVEKFKSSSAQAIYSARNAWKDDKEVSARVEEAYRLYKIAMVDISIASKK